MTNPSEKFKNLKRKLNEMPSEIRDLLESKKLLSEFEARPAYQQNDYLGWIERARRPETREKRIRQMIDELHDGHLYMKMKYRPK